MLVGTGCVDLDALDRCEREPCPPPCTAQVAAGWSHTCARKANGTVWCWGINNASQLGTGESASDVKMRNAPSQVKGLTAATAIVAGDSHSCAIVDGGQAWCWGYNGDGQLGDGQMLTTSSVPVLTRNVSDAIKIGAGGNTSCAIRAAGSVACWGSNEFGQIGNGATANAPLAVAVGGLSHIVELGAGMRHVCALDDAGRVWCWGQNITGQLGDGTTDSPRRTPVAAQITGVTHLTAGLNHTCATKNDGSVWCWGQNNLGQVGLSTSSAAEPVPKQVPALANIVEINAGGYEQAGPISHTCARERSGHVWCWGSNTFGELGNDTSSSQVSAPSTIESMPDAFAIGVGAKHSCAIRRNGTLWCWGSNDQGQLGSLNFTEEHVPVGSALACP